MSYHSVGYIFVNHSFRLDCCERYDPSTDSWTVLASMKFSRDAVGVSVLGDKVYAVGGYDGIHYLKVND